VVLTVAVAPAASACSCVGGTTQRFFADADAVFTGRLVSREEPATVTSSADPALHVFAVDTVYKGTVHQSQGVISPVSGATCGLELTGDGPFVVFATRSADLGVGEFTRLAEDQYAASSAAAPGR
jgi:lactam utilization protein B